MACRQTDWSCGRQNYGTFLVPSTVSIHTKNRFPNQPDRVEMEPGMLGPAASMTTWPFEMGGLRPTLVYALFSHFDSLPAELGKVWTLLR